MKKHIISCTELPCPDKLKMGNWSFHDLSFFLEKEPDNTEKRLLLSYVKYLLGEIDTHELIHLTETQ